MESKKYNKLASIMKRSRLTNTEDKLVAPAGVGRGDTGAGRGGCRLWCETGSRMYCTTWGIQPLFYNCTERITFQNCEWLYCIPEHHQLNGQEFEQTVGDAGGQRSLAHCSPWGHKESDTTYKWTTAAYIILYINCTSVKKIKVSVYCINPN